MFEYLDEVEHFIVSGPLYVRKDIRHNAKPMYAWSDVLPQTVSGQCETGRQETRWTRVVPNKSSEPYAGFHETVYNCRNCSSVDGMHVYFHWSSDEKIFSYTKVGQWPKFEISPPKELEKALTREEI